MRDQGLRMPPNQCQPHIDQTPYESGTEPSDMAVETIPIPQSDRLYTFNHPFTKPHSRPSTLICHRACARVYRSSTSLLHVYSL